LTIGGGDQTATSSSAKISITGSYSATLPPFHLKLGFLAYLKIDFGVGFGFSSFGLTVYSGALSSFFVLSASSLFLVAEEIFLVTSLIGSFLSSCSTKEEVNETVSLS